MFCSHELSTLRHVCVLIYVFIIALLRLNEIESGGIFIDGIDITKIGLVI
jgi:hypothetical protein